MLFFKATFTRLRDGPVKLLLLETATRLATVWLANESDRASTSANSVTSSSYLSGSYATAGGDHHRAIKKALEEAETCRQKLAVEACLHRNRITAFWPDILARAPT